MKGIFFALIFGVLFSSCSKKVKDEAQVYFNDFEQSDLKSITHGSIENYNNTNVLGRYSSGGFDLNLTNLPNHKLVEISFDLYIHDSWDGNKRGPDDVDGPDIWKFIVDGNLYINTTFSNADCDHTGFCPPQSYPLAYPNNTQNPKTGAANPNLPGVCNLAGKPGGTTLYKISKIIEHADSKLLMQCRDQLTQKNAENSKCDESWSVDNLRIKVIEL